MNLYVYAKSRVEEEAVEKCVSPSFRYMIEAKADLGFLLEREKQPREETVAILLQREIVVRVGKFTQNNNYHRLKPSTVSATRNGINARSFYIFKQK